MVTAPTCVHRGTPGRGDAERHRPSVNKVEGSERQGVPVHKSEAGEIAFRELGGACKQRSAMEKPG